MRDSTKSDRNAGVSRRKVLECMTWAGTGVLWTISGGVPLSLGIIDGALAAPASKLTFLQISDSHIAAGKTFLYDSHRGHHASLQASRVRQRQSRHLPGRARRALRAGRARFPRRGDEAVSRSLRQE